MNPNIQKLRRELDMRARDIQALKKTRATSLALTACEQSRILLGRVQQILLGKRAADDRLPAPVKVEANDSAGAYVPPEHANQATALRYTIERMEEIFLAFETSRRDLWFARGDRIEGFVGSADAQAVLCKSWLELELEATPAAPVAVEPKATPAAPVAVEPQPTPASPVAAT